MFSILIHGILLILTAILIQFLTYTYSLVIQLITMIGILTLGIIGCFLIHYYKKHSYGTVIILNGPSASGKTSTQKAFQEYMLSKKLWIKIGVDNLLAKPFSPSLWYSSHNFMWIENTKDNKSVMTLQIGPEGDKVAFGMNSSIAAYAKAGNNVIVDYIAYKKEWVDDLNKKLKDIKHYWIKVDISLEMLEQREKARATSPVGHSRSHYDTVHWNITYDFTVNTEKNTASEIAQKIEKFLHSKK